MSRGGNERMGAGGGTGREARQEVSCATPQGKGKEEPPRAERAPTERERARNKSRERAETLRADDRRGKPTVPEQQMMGILGTLGERYGDDYQREYKIRDGDWYLTHVDVAFPADRLIIEVYGGVHREPLFDRTGTRVADDERRVREIESLGWEVLVVHDYEMSRDNWLTAVEKVQRFLDEGRDRWPGQGLGTEQERT